LAFICSIAAFAAVAISSALVIAQTTTATAPSLRCAKQQATPAKDRGPSEDRHEGVECAENPWGDPDLQGVWNDATSTPLQRPNGKGETVGEGDASQFEEQLASDLNRDRRDGGLRSTSTARTTNTGWIRAG
jgi:hypothetical protein